MGASVSCVAGEGNGAPLLYLPGMDGIGYTFSAQADLLATRGYEVWCLKLPASDRRPLDALAEALAPLVARVAERHGTGVTLVAESFGAPTALRLAGSAHTGSAVSRLVFCNPATNLSESNMLVGTASAAGLFQLLPLVPTELISWARGTVWPLMLEEGRVDVPVAKPPVAITAAVAKPKFVLVPVPAGPAARPADLAERRLWPGHGGGRPEARAALIAQ